MHALLFTNIFGFTVVLLLSIIIRQLTVNELLLVGALISEWTENKLHTVTGNNLRILVQQLQLHTYIFTYLPTHPPTLPSFSIYQG
jgi:hypothetical protein